ncbi:MAG TPA: hypothetical protein VNQ15_16365 [Verrucomicrobiae bacterium]|jgi:hypothetical protein|nr:hypothetical protein [Verrucomicrobiae bacterium]
MAHLRLFPFLLMLPLVAGCMSGSRYASYYEKTWDKAGGTEGELKKDRRACRQETGVGADDPRTLGGVQLTPAENEAIRPYLDCMKARGWWIINPTTYGA